MPNGPNTVPKVQYLDSGLKLFAIVFLGGSEYRTKSLVQWGSELQVGLLEGVNLSYFEVSVKPNNIVFCIKRDLIITPRLSTLNWFLIHIISKFHFVFFVIRSSNVK